MFIEDFTEGEKFQLSFGMDFGTADIWFAPNPHLIGFVTVDHSRDKTGIFLNDNMYFMLHNAGNGNYNMLSWNKVYHLDEEEMAKCKAGEKFTVTHHNEHYTINPEV